MMPRPVRQSQHMLRQVRIPQWARRVRIHPLFLALLGLAIFAGLWREMCVLFLLVMLHEMGHAAMAHHLGYEVESVSLLPFGGVARLGFGNIGFHPRHEAAIAIAGPCVNLAMSGAVWVFFATGLCSIDFVHQVVGLNAWIVGFNLLPGLPLDGGRVLRAARSRSLGFYRATREAYTLAIILSLVLLVIGGVAFWSGSPHFGMVILSLFLLYSAVTGRRDVSMEVVRFLDSKKRLGYRAPTQVNAVVTPGSSTVREVVRQFAPDRYHMVYVLDRSGSIQTVLEEDELLAAVFDGRWMTTIEQWIERE